MMAATEREHLSPDTVEDYFRLGAAAAFQMGTEVESVLEIDPSRQEMRLISPALGGEPEVAGYERIAVERTSLIGRQGDWFQLTVDATSMHYEAYVLIESIVDQLESGAPFRHAVSESLSGFKDLLSGRSRLSDEKEAGLIGELLVLHHVLGRLGENTAVGAWLGPLSEEHDFGFQEFDAEVKTTRSESRVHVIGSESQLQPVPGRPLYLVSVQITLAGAAAEGFTLTSLISLIRARLDLSRRAFDAQLERLGWKDSDADLYRKKYQLRSKPRSYLVDLAFPAITGPQLDEVVPKRALVSGVSYRVDVSHLPFVAPPTPLNDYCEDLA
ncbi:PD-(D/E)XK motif protein [Glutamicibacter protophormiae]|uniref:PD-(D/E)XK motif protein n=1 Tax=Glutamicibacter protophormiae TaxID=37930 RepID=UPI002A7F134A|nr:PD-(D/E)XK motif protein [Glutamicibacter protophormiae]WPR64379.1 PD-(D/E)XK motif protein [Glutamicibacter protophormiae]WPR67872.1 PD-(D/E)XK motif protein [Glutamicibacter protophormiae]